jgi:hypothetical protein
MLDVESRKIAVELVRKLAGGQLTNDEFDNQYPRSNDRAIITIWGFLWFCWDDRFTHKLEGEYRLTQEKIATVERCIAFLQTDLDYLGPSIGKGALDATVSMWRRFVGKENKIVIQGALDDPWWPFATEEQFRQYCQHEATPNSVVRP